MFTVYVMFVSGSIISDILNSYAVEGQWIIIIVNSSLIYLRSRGIGNITSFSNP